jgi:DNA excision repair protein ERCC-3
MLNVRPDNPVIVQGDGKVLLETAHFRYEAARDFLSRFAELETSPAHLHTYRITPLSLWNAASAGISTEEVLDGLASLSKFDVPSTVTQTIQETIDRYGLVQLLPHPSHPKQLMSVRFATLYIAKVASATAVGREMIRPDGKNAYCIDAGYRGIFKQRMLQEGWPVEDLGGFEEGAHLPIRLRERTRSDGSLFEVRPYQWASTHRWYQDGRPSGGHGVVVLPCGAGKTIVGLAVMSLLQTHTLILATNTQAVNQWEREILDRTYIQPNQVGVYTGERKEIRPITIATYQILTWRASRENEFAHLGIFRDHDWGLLIYDEVHLLPAPVFGATAELQGRRRLGLTATLVREDGREGDVFSLVGPKRFDLPWQDLEHDGFIAEARCWEIRVPFTNGDAERYEHASETEKFKIAASNASKIPVLKELVRKHAHDHVLVIGTYLEQLHEVARMLHAPLITGDTPQARREDLYARFRRGEIPLLVVSKVANFSIDLPDANVAIQISGSFGSRQEEAQRLGRVLRPKDTGADFYTVITRETKEQEFAHKRQLFLTEQGYRYVIDDRAAVS